MKPGPKPKDWKTRLMDHAIPIPECGCWLWDASINEDGYGKFTIDRDGRYIHAHKVSWILFFGEIPEEKQINHKCHVRSCVNPNHLYLGTQLENVKDMWLAGRGPKRNGENNGRAKLSFEQAECIKKSKLGTRLLAEQYNLAMTTIQRIRNGRAWAKP